MFERSRIPIFAQPEMVDTNRMIKQLHWDCTARGAHNMTRRNDILPFRPFQVSCFRAESGPQPGLAGVYSDSTPSLAKQPSQALYFTTRSIMMWLGPATKNIGTWKQKSYGATCRGRRREARTTVAFAGHQSASHGECGRAALQVASPPPQMVLNQVLLKPFGGFKRPVTGLLITPRL